MGITDPMFRMCWAMVAGLVLVSVSVGDERGEVRGERPLPFAAPLAADAKNPGPSAGGGSIAEPPLVFPGKDWPERDRPASSEGKPKPVPIRLHPDNPHYFLWRGKPTI